MSAGCVFKCLDDSPAIRYVVGFAYICCPVLLNTVPKPNVADEANSAVPAIIHLPALNLDHAAITPPKIH